MKETDVLIIGGGPVGITASRMIRSMAPDMRVTVIRPERASVIYCAIPYAIEGLFPMEKILKQDSLVTKFGGEIIQKKAVRVDFDNNQVELDDGSIIGYATLLIATGANPARPPIPGLDSNNVFTVKTEDDARHIVSYLEGQAECDDLSRDEDTGAKKAVVVGAGAIGVEQALAYVNRGLEVDLIDIAPFPLPNMLDPEFASIAYDELKKHNVRCRFGKKVDHFEKDPKTNNVRAVALNDGTEIEIDPAKDFVILAVGMSPNLELFRDTKLETGRSGVIVDDRMRTNIDNVYAAGDVCQFVSGIDGETLEGKLATNAVPMARIAARNILGQDYRYPGFFNGAVTVVGDLRFGGTGFPETFSKKRGFEPITGYGETTTRFPMMPGAGIVKIKIVADKTTGRVIGGQAVGPEAIAERIDVITLAIQNNMTVRELMDFSYTSQPWQTFFPARNAIVEATTDAEEKRLAALRGTL